MELLNMILVVLGLCLFETINSIDNAIINAEVLGTMGQRARRWFLSWGLIFAVFLVFLFFHWLFLESKNFGLRLEPFFFTKGIWFYAVVSVILSVVVWFSVRINPMMAFGAVVGSTAFFITHGFKQTAERNEAKLIKGTGMSDLSKISTWR